MAIKDFNEYLFKVNEQVIAAKEDLQDFEQGLKEGHVTEDQVTGIKDEYEKININFQRLLYCAYLLSIPNRKSKKAKYSQQTKRMQEFLQNNRANDEAVLEENKEALNLLREEIKKLTNGNN